MCAGETEGGPLTPHGNGGYGGGVPTYNLTPPDEGSLDPETGTVHQRSKNNPPPLPKESGNTIDNHG